MQHAVTKCPKVCITKHGIQIPSLLDSCSEVTLLWQSYFNKHILPKIKLATGQKADAHMLFKLMVVNDGQMLIKMESRIGPYSFGAQSAKCWHVNHRRTKPGTC